MLTSKNYVKKASGHTEVHLCEKEIFNRLLETGRVFLEAFVEKSGPKHAYEKRPLSQDGQALEYKGMSERAYFSIFGEIRIERARYLLSSGDDYHPLDTRLNLPQSKYSYLLQKWLQISAVETNYRESTNRFEEIFGFTVRRMTNEVSIDVDSFYDQVAAPAPEIEGECLAIGADGKGVRLIKSERPKQKVTREPKARLSRGEKPGMKKEAVVTADFSFNPQSRKPEEIVKVLLNQFTAEERKEAQL